MQRKHDTANVAHARRRAIPGYTWPGAANVFAMKVRAPLGATLQRMSAKRCQWPRQSTCEGPCVLSRGRPEVLVGAERIHAHPCPLVGCSAPPDPIDRAACSRSKPRRIHIFPWERLIGSEHMGSRRRFLSGRNISGGRTLFADEFHKRTKSARRRSLAFRATSPWRAQARTCLPAAAPSRR